MRILFLGPSSPLIAWLDSIGEEIIREDKKINSDDIKRVKPDFIISYGYRHIIGDNIVDAFDGMAINLHISYLPWNRGADPNFWSFFEDTPKGVTIHYLDTGIDTGDIIVQEGISFSKLDTLKTSYDKLHGTIQRLFKTHWTFIRDRQCGRFPQPAVGTSHKSKDKDRFLPFLTKGWDTLAIDLNL